MFAAIFWCWWKNIPVVCSYHTHVPEYVRVVLIFYFLFSLVDIVKYLPEVQHYGLGFITEYVISFVSLRYSHYQIFFNVPSCGGLL